MSKRHSRFKAWTWRFFNLPPAPRSSGSTTSCWVSFLTGCVESSRVNCSFNWSQRRRSSNCSSERWSRVCLHALFASLSGGNLSHCTHYSSGRHTLTRVCLSGLGKEIGESMDSAGIDRASWDSAEMEDASERTAALAASGLLRESARSVDLKPAG